MRTRFRIQIEDLAAQAIVEQSTYYSAHENQELVQRWQSSVDQTIQSLLDFPHRGAPFRYGSSRFRSVRHISVPGFPKHAVYYRVEGDLISVLHVLHGARDLEAELLASEESDL